ncbi:MAG TPA: toxic anion resistance protein [Spirochaetota bacterium]|nr:toxic anion resistance protein [Spirochaetota bacterium]HQO00789.1 toxic anion resistance protein [Spirochaetota bacterium]HQP49015.1 toxic anion resistance protein [Spirochaetota bacterium]
MDIAAQQPQEVTAFEKLNDEEKKKVEEIRSSFNVDDSQEIIQFGVGAQSKISGFADNILDQIRAKDAGYAGEVLTELMLKVKEIDVDSLSDGSFVSKIPIIGSIVDSAKKFAARFQKLSTEIENIIDELTKARMQLLKDVTLFDNLYEKNLEYLKELDLYIIAGQMKIKDIQEKVLPELKAKADASGDPVDAQKYQDMNQMLNRFEKKIHDLKLSRMVSIQTSPQIRLIQNNNQVLVEKIQSSILNTIPLWKNQIIIAIGIFRQKKALKLQKEVTDTTNQLLSKNAEMLKDSTIEVAKESERGIVDIETLKKVNNDLISTIEETLKIQQEGKLKRQQAEVELSQLENDLKKKLTEIKG